MQTFLQLPTQERSEVLYVNLGRFPPGGEPELREGGVDILKMSWLETPQLVNPFLSRKLNSGRGSVTVSDSSFFIHPAEGSDPFDSFVNPPEFTGHVDIVHQKIVECGSRVDVVGCPQCLYGECDRHESKPHYCHNKYCINPYCKFVVYSQALARLSNRSIRSDRLYHFAVGSIFKSKQELGLAVGKFIRSMRHGNVYKGRRKYNLYYDRVFDIGTASYSTTGLPWLHYHFAILPEKGFDTSTFIDDCRAVLDGSALEFQNIGYRPKEAIYHYFSLRIAGILGHRDDGFSAARPDTLKNILISGRHDFKFYPDIMNFNTYYSLLYRRQTVTHGFPEGLVYTTATFKAKSPICPEHHESYIHLLSMKKESYERFQGFKDKLRPEPELFEYQKIKVEEDFI